MLKKVPNRMCVACHTMKPKKELVRIVINSQEEISIDLTGKAQGRGAYLCKSTACLELARKGKKLERALKHQIPEETMQFLANSFKESP